MRVIETEATKGKPYIFQRKFDSVHELASYAQSITLEDQLAQYGHDNRSSVENSASFSDGMNFEEAVATGLKGGRWDEGAKHLAELEIKANVQGGGTRGQIKASVVGSRASVPRYLSSNPRTMTKTVRSPAKAKVIKLGIDCGASANVPHEYMYNKGAAVLSYVKALELKGYSVAVDVITDSVDKRGEQCKNRIQTTVTVKHANSKMTAADIAFPVAHSAFFRRLFFTCIETGGKAAKKLCNGCYGFVAENPEIAGYDAICAGIFGTSTHKYATLEQALETVKTELDSQLIKQNLIK